MPDTPPSSDRVSARRAEIQERCNEADLGPDWAGPIGAASVLASTDVPALLALAEGVIRMAGEWDKMADAIDDSAVRASLRGALPSRTEQMAARAQARRDDAEALRAHIARALLGEG